MDDPANKTIRLLYEGVRMAIISLAKASRILGVGERTLYNNYKRWLDNGRRDEDKLGFEVIKWGNRYWVNEEAIRGLGLKKQQTTIEEVDTTDF